MRKKINLKSLKTYIQFAYTRYVICPHCRGNGAESHEDISICSKCNGQGNIRERQTVGPGFVQIFDRPYIKNIL